MAIQGESLFALVRRRESIRALAQQRRAALPSSLTDENDTTYEIPSETPAEKLQKDLAKLDAKKKEHLVIPYRKGGKKLNRLSYIGLFLGLIIAGAVFFTAGYLMCLSVNPPNGGIIFEPKFATASVGKSIQTPIGQTEEKFDVMPDVPQKSYVDRQALLARTGGRSEQKGLLERSEERTYS
ncbi:MAG: hypothetical protein ACRYGR_05340 [Janthinobacterium lividum]